ncbi:hypothetical protein [Sporosarcina sp. 6E9]|uniref:hypothetical protein n=1 Tax=Sporosarcina sp. 6E9 TaxID=2819235 RepID=UPI001B30F871|nr:hypothetical protein [Sporosarcina sp. 6E9]
MIIVILAMLVLTGCNTLRDAEAESKVEKKGPQPLTLQVLKMDEEEGITLDNNDVYKEINGIDTENPDFSIQTGDMLP